MNKYSVDGMHCAACSARVEKAVNKVPGVDSCSVSLLTNSMGVEGSASPEEIIRAVENAGYEAALMGEGKARASERESSSEAVSQFNENLKEQEKALEDRDTPRLRKRLTLSATFLLVLMYFSMGHSMWGWPLPPQMEGNHIAMALVQMILAAVVMLINKDFFTSGFSSLIHGGPNMDTLVAMGSFVSFAWSTVILFKMTSDQLAGDGAAVMKDMHGLYFESAAMIVTLITVGKMLEAMSKGRTTDALKSLMKLVPQTAVIEEGGEEKEVPVSQVAVGDLIVVRAGESIPVDAQIVSGEAAVDESALTGESIPVDKGPGDRISAATVNMSGYIRARATRVGQDTTLSQIISMVSDAAATKAPIAKIADKVSGIFVPAVLIIAAAVTAIWLLLGETPGFALARGISVLVISCPCALGLATPVAIMVGNGMGAKNGILFKTSAALEETGRINIVALDKTGTITNGRPVVTDVIPAEGFEEKQLLSLAYSIEKKSEHPLSKAIITKAAEEGLSPEEAGEFKVIPGKGLSAVIDGSRVLAGNLPFIAGELGLDLSKTAGSAAEELAGQGKTCLYFARDKKFAGIVAVADTIREDSPQAIREFHEMGIKVVMLTGDNQITAAAIGKQAGVDQVIAGVLPGEKEKEIRRLGETGKVAMVGDGINDAPALTRADIGIAIGAGADVAVDAADVVLVNSKLTDASAAIRLSRATVKNIKENLFWAFFYNILLIPLAAGLYTALFHGWTMNPMLGAAAMSLSSFSVCMNALRLNFFKIHKDSPDMSRQTDSEPAREENEKNQQSENAVISADNITEPKEENTMTKTMKIEGMMCTHCEATVKKALESLDGVTEAKVSHEAGEAVVSMTSDVADDALKKAVEDKDYTVVSVN
ncbi:MAG: heavy metal translocating P-type ATPase [Eubacteriales bacterium]